MYIHSRGRRYRLPLTIGLSFGLPEARTEEQWKLEALSALFAESRLRWQLSDDIVTDICSDHPVRIEPDLRPCPLGSNSNDGVDHMLRPYCLGHPILTVHPVEKAE